MMLRRHRRSGQTKAADLSPKQEQKSFDDLTVPELKDKAKEKEVEGYSQMKRDELIEALQD